jgi:hypothetical protein
MPITARRTVTAIAAAAISTLVLILSALPAEAAIANSPHQYCATIVSKKQTDSHGNSKVLSQQCSTTSQVDALSQAAALRPHAGTRQFGPADQTLLINEYLDANYGGGVLYSFYGDYGGCDRDGYHLLNFWNVEHNTSSIQGYNNCNAIGIHTEDCNADESVCDWGYFRLDLPYVGDHYNDHVTVVRPYHSA